MIVRKRTFTREPEKHVQSIVDITGYTVVRNSSAFAPSVFPTSGSPLRRHTAAATYRGPWL
jgi:hypothetical protein